jgi:hypothetical protein
MALLGIRSLVFGTPRVCECVLIWKVESVVGLLTKTYICNYRDLLLSLSMVLALPLPCQLVES